MIRPTANFQPIAPVPAPTRVVPTATPSVQGRSGAGASSGTQAQQTAKFAAALVNSSRELSRRDLFAKINALQSQANKQHEMSHLLLASHERSLEESARLLRTKLKKGLLQQVERGKLLKQVLDSMAGDAARAHALLQAAARQARSERSVNEQQMLGQQLQLLREQHGRAPRQPINTGSNTRILARGNEDPLRRDKLRGLYSVAVAEQLNVIGLIEALMSSTEDEGQGQQDRRERFEAILREVRQVVARDMAELDSSASPQKLRTMMYAVNTAQYVATLFGSCEHLLGRMRNKNPGIQVETSAFLRNLLGLIGKGMALNETLQLTQQIGGRQLKHQLAFLNGLRPMLHQLPIMLWRDVKSRQNALGNLLTLMAALTSEEQKRLRAGSA